MNGTCHLLVFVASVSSVCGRDVTSYGGGGGKGGGRRGEEAVFTL